MNSTPLKNFIGIYTVLLVLVSLLYANTLQTPFQFDDEKIENNQLIRDITYYTKISSISYRHFTMLSYALNYSVGKLNTTGYHLLSIILHASAVLLVFLIVHVTIDKGTSWGKTAALRIAFSTSLLYTVNPVQSEAITYITGRASCLAAVLFLLSLYFFIQGSLQQPGIQLPKPLSYLFSIIFLFLSIISKETAITLPLVMIIYDACFMKSGQWTNRKFRILRFYIFFPLPIILLLFKSGNSIAIFRWWLGQTDWLYALNQLKVLIYGIKLFFLPLNLVVEYDIPYTDNFLTHDFIFSTIFWVAILYLTAKYKIWKSSVLFFSILWYLATISPTNSFIPREDLFSERNLYLPSFGLCFLFAVLFHFLFRTGAHSFQNSSAQTSSPGKPKIQHNWIFTFGLMIIVANYSCLLISRNFIYKTPITFWEDAYKKTPKKLRLLHNLSFEYIKANNYKQAVDILQKMQLIRPRYYYTHLNLAKIYMHYGYFPLAEDQFLKAIDSNQDQFEPYYNLGSLYAKLGNLSHAENMYKQALEKSGGSEYPELNYNLATVYFKLGKYKEAESEIGTSLTRGETMKGRILAAQIFERTGREDLAEYIYLNTIKNDTVQQAIAHNSLGLLYINKNRYDDALIEFEKSISFNPKLIEAHLNLAKILIDVKKETDKALPHLKIAAELNTDPQRGEFINRLISQITG